MAPGTAATGELGEGGGIDGQETKLTQQQGGRLEQ